jgi:UDP:flavonoid glycosyltransferase YjiC (YdhE family)
MRITILTVGSRGDVQPFIALGLGLQQAGHTVQLATHSPFQAMVHSYGLEFAPIEGDVPALMAGETGQQMLETGNPLQLIQRYAQMVEPLLAQGMADSWKACQSSEAIIGTAYTSWGYDIAQKLGIPFYFAALMPQSANPDFPFPSLPPTLPLGGFLNSLTYPVLLEGFGLMFRKSINQFRQTTLQLSPLPRWTGLYGRLDKAGVPYLYGFSPTVVPKPSNWETRLHVTGYWFLEHPQDWTPPEDLLAFLAAGSPPVYIGYGSMTGREPFRMTDMALAALAKTGQRGILLTGWGGICAADLPETVFKLESAPHDWLFPRMAAIVHHGGAGTSAAALRAGVPSVVVPFFGDQPFWAHRLLQLGVTPAPIPKSSLTADRLAAAIAIAVSDETMHQRVRVIGNQIRADNGVQQAVAAFQHCLCHQESRI